MKNVSEENCRGKSKHIVQKNQNTLYRKIKTHCREKSKHIVEKTKHTVEKNQNTL
jgi:hypothetical protein